VQDHGHATDDDVADAGFVQRLEQRLKQRHVVIIEPMRT
jgi:hypothetical protein